MTLALLGPTASGKSTLAVELATHLTAHGRPAEIVNADSMLVYRGMDIGTAKPTVEERRGIPHHLVDVLDITQTATVADFQQLAREAIASCQERGVVPIVVGGSALYLRAILDEFRRIDEMGGVMAAVEQRYQRSQIQLSAHRFETQIHAGQRPVVGVNLYRPKIDHTSAVPMVRTPRSRQQLQISRLRAFKKKHARQAGPALDRLERIARDGGNTFQELLR
jgi:energy-coupling factor transporter ATP-binding protein EcfA2